MESLEGFVFHLSPTLSLLGKYSHFFIHRQARRTESGTFFLTPPGVFFWVLLLLARVSSSI